MCFYHYISVPLAFLCFLPDAVFRRAVLLVVSMALFPDG
ncbi:hypothetical protein CLOLEP_00324 [[Clostridium] leptum DSM 753]|uniref:Uncharacterized protein n=1 Tax=[Clostridium] leptum DSM 753 TaxID=428125 RepID=A7VP48_9FIRM|nr:hypothetical protein CLOLEP_00324 [[Clostridium] leptum DSM 753]